MITALSVLAVVALGGYLFLQQPVFGGRPTGQRLARMQQSPQFRDGIFHNEHNTPMMVEGVSYPAIIWKFFFGKKPNAVPGKALPALRTDLRKLSDSVPVLVWFGHSSYFIKAAGQNILVDPVFSGHASPVSFVTKSFAGTDVYTVDDFPDIDILLITHDHYDHLDYETILNFIPKVKLFVTSLGVGAHLERWGVEANRIRELDWWESTEHNGIHLTATPARHFSGRGLKRFNTLWSSFVVCAADHRLYLGGDSGYDDHFSRIAEKYGPFDFALIECGQYNEAWRYIHMLPEEAVQAGFDVKANVTMPVHSAKFSLALHSWRDPLERFSREAIKRQLNYCTPLIGEPVIIGSHYPQCHWWQADSLAMAMPASDH